MKALHPCSICVALTMKGASKPAPKACCAPRRTDAGPCPHAALEQATGGAAATATHMPMPRPGGAFHKGDPFAEEYAKDGELPAHTGRVAPYSVDPTAITHAEFAASIDETGHLTDAERYGSSAVFHLAVRADPADVVGQDIAAPWQLARG
ncbi:SUMF1/EgtB/PvdO family nonheme iron enzyme [Kribbella sp. CA-294648]|uniref:SUMF1/EgtB/PvdO family nonheme iron enzyme n=1 Tax=Kribbella sp. CA-294648 TaxID=3239948 RepID=UPI003D946132